LHRSWRRGRTRLEGYLEDYANTAEGLLALYQATFEERFFTAARELVDHALAHFADPQGGFFDTGDEHEALVTRPKDVQDNATPSGSGMLVTVLLKLAAYTGETRYAEAAEANLRSMQPLLAQYPTAFGQWLQALAFALAQPREIALVGQPGDPGLEALRAVVEANYRPFSVVALKPPGQASAVPLLAERDLVGGRASAAVCYRFACQLPVTEPEALRAQLDPASGDPERPGSAAGG
jgi:uncharacterized protein YyaL (SSP411 family)